MARTAFAGPETSSATPCESLCESPATYIRMSHMNFPRFVRSSLAVGLLITLTQAIPAAQMDTSLFTGLRWRSIGPNRGGRSQAIAGSPSRPYEYYFGATGGGVWKTTDAGLTWR